MDSDPVLDHPSVVLRMALKNAISAGTTSTRSGTLRNSLSKTFCTLSKLPGRAVYTRLRHSVLVRQALYLQDLRYLVKVEQATLSEKELNALLMLLQAVRHKPTQEK